MTARKYRVTHTLDARFAEDQRAVDSMLRAMYAKAYPHALRSQPHRIAVIRTAWGYLYELRWVVR